MSDVNPHALQELADLGVHVTVNNNIVAEKADILLLCTKPDHALPALRAAAPSLRPSTLVVSIAAGLPLAALEGALPKGTRVARVMPNTPALVGLAASAFAMGTNCNEEDARKVQALMDSVGVGQTHNTADDRSTHPLRRSSAASHVSRPC